MEAKYTKVGSSIAKIPQNPQDHGHRIIMNMEAMERIQKEIDYYQRNVDIVNELLGHSSESDKRLLNERYFKRTPIDQICIDLGLARTTIFERTESIIKRFVFKYKSPD
ncbi:MAG TPA: hypothetical protein DCQ90_06495 [Erysipelotrichaceae bacterium]|nr:hypothetical protein [Erysipelotrichaceae bacterium]